MTLLKRDTVRFSMNIPYFVISEVAGIAVVQRLPTLEELTNAAIFVASADGSAIIGTILNLRRMIIN